MPFPCNPCTSKTQHIIPSTRGYVSTLLFAGGGGGGFLAREGGGGGGPLILAPATLPCDVAGDIEASP